MATGFPVPVDWNDAIGMMNWATTARQITWTLRDARTGRENTDVVWRFRRGDVVRIRVVNDPAVFHAMAHPIHIHGQRVLVLQRNGVPTANHVWKDTALIQAGETVELLVEMSNPGKWMLHCHIAEHLGAGMMMTFEVQYPGHAPVRGRRGADRCTAERSRDRWHRCSRARRANGHH
jgi:FtsP/CotA-like multicopper oxidase with cupredoxin domain